VLGKRVLLFVLAFGAIASGRSAAQGHNEIMAEVKRLQVQVSQLEASQLELREAVDKLSKLLQDQDAAVRRTLVDTGTTLQSLQEHMLVLSEKLDETNGRLGNMRRELTSLRPTQPIVIPEEGAAPATPEEGTSETPEMQPVQPLAINSPDLYQQAYTDYTQGRYPLAIAGFKELLSVDPGSDLADNAQYWIGECLLAQRQYREALEAFDAVLTLYPDSNKLPEATYKKAVALEALGSRTDAEAQLEAVIQNYPDTPAARAAEGMLRNLRQQ
jgi:tol-pal system protein YbgF